MAEIDTTETLDPLTYATELRIHARTHAPDVWIEGQVQRLATRIQLKYGTSTRWKKTQILIFVKDSGGTSSPAEIREKFQWPRQSVHELLDELEEERRIEFYCSTPVGPKRAGRPSRRLRLL
jgi:hypothetical protein